MKLAMAREKPLDDLKLKSLIYEIQERISPPRDLNNNVSEMDMYESLKGNSIISS